MSPIRHPSATARTSTTVPAQAPSPLDRRQTGRRGTLLALHRRYGNRRVQSIIQAKLNPGPVDGSHRRDADRASEPTRAGV